MKRRGAIAAWAGLALLGCGDPLVDQRYRGEPIFKATGTLAPDSMVPVSALTGDVLAAVFWKRSLEPSGGLRAQLSASATVELPATIEVLLFAPPEPADFVEEGGSYALGFLLLFVDLDRNGRYDEGTDRIIGGDFGNAFVYSPQVIEAEASPSGTTLPAGFSLINRTLLCNWRLRSTATDPLPDYAPCEVGRRCAEGYACRAITQVCAEEPSGECTPVGGSCGDGYRCDPSGPSCYPIQPSYQDICVGSTCQRGETCADLLRCLPAAASRPIACGPSIGCAAGLICDQHTRSCTPLLPFTVELSAEPDLSRLGCATL